MAKAMVMRIEQGYVDRSIPYLQIGILYSGVDVPGNLQIKSLSVDVSGVVNLVDLGTTVAAAVRSLATANGYTVGASNVFLPSYAAA